MRQRKSKEMKREMKGGSDIGGYGERKEKQQRRESDEQRRRSREKEQDIN